MADLSTLRIASGVGEASPWGNRPEGWIIINATDFDPNQHERWQGEPVATADDQDSSLAEAPAEALEDMSLDELKQLASDRKLKGRSSMSKDELIEALR
ncbi:Rho termination factor N-terminal domain-containing protein [Nodosilinea sp. LEGE 07298]|uniref:Rho termination factor N-terminal domain-containing protein n=1 Tax=Nodosilinea sp. LEGE 07298 TaxID=2777970 RepID=UPI0018817DC0|nr:Rho termination factor N-terminal domain-containing protein [Nodosilinea sp. LEGE 07298]MBE9113944.1 Rho termination factor N-terminal domain-containing protein [Nodosilinea sp. LEGE 07298]